VELLVKITATVSTLSKSPKATLPVITDFTSEQWQEAQILLIPIRLTSIIRFVDRIQQLFHMLHLHQWQFKQWILILELEQVNLYKSTQPRTWTWQQVPRLSSSLFQRCTPTMSIATRSRPGTWSRQRSWVRYSRTMELIILHLPVNIRRLVEVRRLLRWLIIRCRRRLNSTLWRKNHQEDQCFQRLELQPKLLSWSLHAIQYRRYWLNQFFYLLQRVQITMIWHNRRPIFIKLVTFIALIQTVRSKQTLLLLQVLRRHSWINM